MRKKFSTVKNREGLYHLTLEAKKTTQFVFQTLLIIRKKKKKRRVGCYILELVAKLHVS